MIALFTQEDMLTESDQLRINSSSPSSPFFILRLVFIRNHRHLPPIGFPGPIVVVASLTYRCQGPLLLRTNALTRNITRVACLFDDV